jgi:lysophospholipase L1-like esterase
VSIAGDSNSYGQTVYARPDTGQFGVLRVQPLDELIDQELAALGYSDIEVIDHSLPASGLLSERQPYLESEQFERLLADRCAVVVVMPFYPDIESHHDASDYVGAVERLIDALVERTPDTQIAVLNFYEPHPQTDVLKQRLTPENIARFNAALEDACRPSGELGSMDHVFCLPMSAWFDDMAPEHLALRTSLAEFERMIDAENDYSELMRDFFAAHPQGELIGDGLHLSTEGRRRAASRLAAFIAEVWRPSP